MRFYDRYILPHLIDFACGPGEVMKIRAQIVPLARTRVARIATPVEMIALEPGQIQAADASFESIVCTFTSRTPWRRVLKPDGRLLFGAHGPAPGYPVVRRQNRLTPYWKPLAGGCHLNRDIPALIQRWRLHHRPVAVGLPERAQAHDLGL